MLTQTKHNSFSVMAADSSDRVACTTTLSGPNDDQAGYVLSIEGEGKVLSYTLPQAPSDTDIRYMAGFIDKSVRDMYDRELVAEQRVMMSQIMNWSAPLIIDDACTKLEQGDIQADHHYIVFGHEAVDNKTNGGCARRKTVLLKQNEKLIKVLNSKTLKQWLMRHPNTLINLSNGGQYVEKALTSTNRQYENYDEVVNDDYYHLMTPTHRFNIKLSTLDDSGVRFTVAGVKIFNTPSFS